MGHEQCAELTRARDHAWIAEADCQAGRPVSIILNGATAVPQELAVFTADGADVLQRWEAVPALSGASQIRI